MNCVLCKSSKAYVIDARGGREGTRRRYQCRQCNRRFSTLEKVISTDKERVYSSLDLMPQPQNYYTVYDAKTDDVLASGNAKECAKQLNMALSSFYSAITKNNSGEHKKYVIISEPYKEIVE